MMVHFAFVFSLFTSSTLLVHLYGIPWLILDGQVIWMAKHTGWPKALDGQKHWTANGWLNALDGQMHWMGAPDGFSVDNAGLSLLVGFTGTELDWVYTNFYIMFCRSLKPQV